MIRDKTRKRKTYAYFRQPPETAVQDEERFRKTYSFFRGRPNAESELNVVVDSAENTVVDDSGNIVIV